MWLVNVEYSLWKSLGLKQLHQASEHLPILEKLLEVHDFDKANLAFRESMTLCGLGRTTL